MRGSNHDQLIQKGCTEHGDGEQKERETRGSKAKSASKRRKADKIDIFSSSKNTRIVTRPQGRDRSPCKSSRRFYFHSETKALRLVMDQAVCHAAVRCHKQNDIAGIPVIQNAFLGLSAHNRIIMKLQITISGPKVQDPMTTEDADPLQDIFHLQAAYKMQPFLPAGWSGNSGMTDAVHR